MTSYAMQAAPDNGFSAMTNCPSVTQFMLNSFLLLNLTSAISPGPAPHCPRPPGERRGARFEIAFPTSRNDSPALFYCIVFCIIGLVARALGDTAICQVHLLGENAKGIMADPVGAYLLSNRRGALAAAIPLSSHTEASVSCPHKPTSTQEIGSASVHAVCRPAGSCSTWLHRHPAF